MTGWTGPEARTADRLRAATPAWAKAAARRAARGYATATSAARPLPDFLVVGTKRGGTTSLFRALQAHPGVAPMFPSLQQTKSPHYFDLHHSRGPRWYRSHFPAEPALRRRAARLGMRPLLGEASPYYLFHPHAPARAAAAIPAAKLIVLLRDPVARAHSHWDDRVRTGHEYLGFAAAIEAEPARLAGELDRMLADPGYESHSYEQHSYLARGRYAEQLERWFEHFPREQFLILRSEDLQRSPEQALRRTCEFLGLPRLPHPDVGRHHASPGRPPITAPLRRALAEYFEPHTARLELLLDRSFGWPSVPAPAGTPHTPREGL